MDLNQKIFWQFNNLAGFSDWGDQVIYFLAEYAGWIIIGGLLAWWLVKKRSALRHRLSHVFLAALLAWVVAMLMKHVSHSDRPFVELQNVDQLVFNVKTYAFPSGHAAFFSALGSAVYLINRKIGLVILISAAVIGLARVAAGIHWPIDVVVGFLVGMIVAIAVLKIVELKDKSA